MSTNDAYFLLCYVVALIISIGIFSIFQLRNKPLSPKQKALVLITAFIVAFPAYLFISGGMPSAIKTIPAPIYASQDALNTFEIDDALQIELVASEPAVQDPVFIAFDENNRIWVCEMTMFMLDEFGTEQEKPGGKIVVLEDKDADGVYEDRKVVIDGIVLPRSLAIVEGGILYADHEQLYFVELKNDEIVEQIVVDPNYAKGGSVEHKTNGLLYGMDHWYYNAKGTPKYKFLNLNDDIPENSTLLVETKYGKFIKAESSARGQWGISLDDYGRLYAQGNSAPLTTEYLFPDSSELDTERSLGDTRVFPIRQNFGSNRGYMVGTLDEAGKLTSYTSASGTHLYRSQALREKYYNVGFTGEVASNTVVARKVTEDQGKMFGERLEANKAFIGSTDERFRPVTITSGPDGALYIVDMYRGIIQDQFFITKYLQRYIRENKLHEGVHMGRIYKVSAKDAKALNEKALSLIDRLSHEASWQRDFARRAIVQGQNKDLIPQITSLIKDNANPTVQINAIWTLQGLNHLPKELLLEAYKISNEKVRSTVILQLRYVSDETRNNLLDHISKYPETIDYQVAAELISLDKYHAIPTSLLKAISSQWPDDRLMRDLLKLGKAGNGKSEINDSHPKQDMNQELLMSYTAGEALYHGQAACGACHGSDGKGITGMGPPLDNSEWVSDSNTLITILLKGLSGPIEVNGKQYNTTMVMPGFENNEAISDEDIADIANYVRNAWKNQTAYISAKTVKQIRKKIRNLEAPLKSRDISPNRDALSQETTDSKNNALENPSATALFNGKDFTGWKKIGGFGKYHIENLGENAVIVGTAHSSPINTFLSTEKQFKNFDLSLEFKVDNSMNSGIQFRSKKLGFAFVQGYQFEIDPSERSWTGGIYHESGGGWLFNLADNEAARAAYKPEAWNKARIRVEGNHIQTWINGVEAVNANDENNLHPEGFIALQVHALWNYPTEAAPQVRWREIYIKEIK